MRINDNNYIIYTKDIGKVLEDREEKFQAADMLFKRLIELIRSDDCVPRSLIVEGKFCDLQW